MVVIMSIESTLQDVGATKSGMYVCIHVFSELKGI